MFWDWCSKNKGFCGQICYESAAFRNFPLEIQFSQCISTLKAPEKLLNLKTRFRLYFILKLIFKGIFFPYKFSNIFPEEFCNNTCLEQTGSNSILGKILFCYVLVQIEKTYFMVLRSIGDNKSQTLLKVVRTGFNQWYTFAIGKKSPAWTKFKFDLYRGARAF